MSQNGLPSLLDRHWAESALAIGAVIIAAVSLWVAFDTERTNRELVASERQLVSANSWPFMEIGENDTNLEGKDGLTLLYMNQGIGPAKLESFELFWKGKPLSGPEELLRTCCQAPGASMTWMSGGLGMSATAGLVLRPGQALNFVYMTRTPASAASMDVLRSNLRNLSFRFCYCSVFDECWLGKRQFGKPADFRPPRVQACPVPTVPYGH
jgi:hypothetical protein